MNFVFSLYFFRVEKLKFLSITYCSTFCLIQICKNLRNIFVTFLVEVRFIWRRQTQTDGRTRESDRCLFLIAMIICLVFVSAGMSKFSTGKKVYMLLPYVVDKVNDY